MDRTVVGMFQRIEDAQAAMTDLHARGFTKDHTSLLVCDNRGKVVQKDVDTGSTGSGAAAGAGAGAAIGGAAGLIAGLAGLAIPGVGPILGIGWLATTLAGAAVGAMAGGIVGALVKAGVPEEEAHVYEEGLRRGHTLVTVRTDAARVNDAAAILNKHHALDVDRAAADFVACGWTPPARKTTAATDAQQARPQATTPPRQTTMPAPAAAARTESVEGEQRIPIVEEHLRVGKRQVERSGSVRIYTHMVEQPVEERVELTEERVVIERRPVDRPAGTTDLNQPERTIEVHERAEEPIVAKEARVVEEVVVKKDATKRTETVRDTVRKTEVDVQPIAGGEQRQASGRRFEDFEREWRTNYKTDFADAASYEQCAPAYRYAYTVAQDPRFRGREFDAAERELREDWERDHPGTWDRYRGGIRRAYGRAKA